MFCFHQAGDENSKKGMKFVEISWIARLEENWLTSLIQLYSFLIYMYISVENIFIVPLAIL